MWLLGINLQAMVMGGPPSSNIIVNILLGIWMVFDSYVLNIVGPILFFWGLTKLLIRGSLKFQELTAKVTRFMSDLGSMSARNVQRNPTRTASIAFLVALIIGYSFQATGAYASERDYTIRQMKFNIGADISVTLTTLVNASKTMNQIKELSDVSSAVLEHSFYGESGLIGGLLSLKAVDPEKWLVTAFYEGEWFTGNDAATAFQQITTDNNTIILERRIASELNLNLNDSINLILGENEVRSLRIIGFFGTEPRARTLPYEDPSYYDGVLSYSYVPEGLYYIVKDNVFATGKILVNLMSGADGNVVADKIRELEANNLGTVHSVAEELQEWQNDMLLSGTFNVQLLGVAFAVVAASIGTALVTLVSLKERRKEVSIMSIRGFSFKKLAMMLLTENLAVVSFAVLLGTIVGLITMYGNMSVANTMPFTNSIITHHMVFPTDMILILFACFVLVFTSTIIPVIVMSLRYVSKLERIVKEP
jgi:ABC-type lipoprotein release transport system permease subunit